MVDEATGELMTIDAHLVDSTPDADANLSDLPDLLNQVIGMSRRKDEGVVAFDLGAGVNPISKEAGFRSVDWFCEADERANLFEYPWRFCDDGAVDCFFSSHFIEHVPPSCWDAFWLEVWRKLRVGGYILLIHPYGNSNRAWQDSTHCQIITEERYWYLNREARKSMGVDHYSAPVNFEIASIWEIWNEDFANLKSEARAFAKKHYINSVDDLVVLLRRAE